MGDLAGKAVLVTGAGRGLGRSVADRLAALGATVGVLDVDAATTAEAAAILAVSGASSFGPMDQGWSSRVKYRAFKPASIASPIFQ